jgi:hypothetical protein
MKFLKSSWCHAIIFADPEMSSEGGAKRVDEWDLVVCSVQMSCGNRLSTAWCHTIYCTDRT